MKLTKKLNISYPLYQKVVRDLKIVTDHVGDLKVMGLAYFNAGETDFFQRYDFDIDSITWNGADIKPVLELTSLIDEINDFIYKTVASLFEENRRVA